MDYQIPVDADTVSELVRSSLEEMLDINLHSGEDDEYTRALIASMMIVLEYYSTKEQYEEFLYEQEEQIRAFNDLLSSPSRGINKVETVEESDGSLTISFNADDETRDQLAAKGVEYSVLRGILDYPSLDDLIRWAQRGKQEEKTDDIMKRFNEARAERDDELWQAESNY